MAQPLGARVSRPYPAGVVELGYTRGLEPRAEQHAGSKPASCTCQIAGVAQPKSASLPGMRPGARCPSPAQYPSSSADRVPGFEPGGGKFKPCLGRCEYHSPVALMIEQPAVNRKVPGSNPGRGAK